MEASAKGQEVVSPHRLLAAAELDPRHLSPMVLASEFGAEEARQFMQMQAKAVAEAVVGLLNARMGQVSTRTLLYQVNPCLITTDDRLLRMRSMWSVRRELVRQWRRRPQPDDGGP